MRSRFGFVGSALGCGVAGLVLLATVAAGGGFGAAVEPAGSGFAAPTATGWVDVRYGPLVDLRRVSHSGQTIGSLLARLEGRSFPPPGERPGDAAVHRLLDPLLEPYAFVLPDALDALEAAPNPPMVEVGGLWRPGEAQPAWAELLRARRYVVESDGAGKMRVFLPWDGGRPGEREASAGEAARAAWEAAWPVLRHVIASERLRLARSGGAPSERPVVQVEVHAYVHRPESTRFRLGFGAHRVRVDDTSAWPGTRPLDLAAWQAFLDRGLSLEGGRLDPDGAVRLLGSPARRPPSLLGRPLTLSDFAVAYRAVFRGGAAEPYMSLDRGDAPDVSNVNFGGRLQDTALGLVSLRSDIRFKTFSLGIDVAEGRDVRGRLVEAVPGFRTHLERFAADPRTQGLMSQQTRLWFYPDAVDVTLSAQGDVLVLRRARMAAASERLGEAAEAASGEEPPWTRETVGWINANYDALARSLSELADLDETARLLTLFTWLRRAGAAGHPLPDLDSLLDAPLPAVPTPRTFPQLLAHNVLPPAGASGAVDVLDRAVVGAALERLRPAEGGDLPPRRRLARALAMLDPRQPDHAALAREVASADPGALDDETLDFLAYRAERLFMHHLVLRALGSGDRARIEARAAAEGKPRIFSVGIGGIDLGMDQAIDRALAGDARLGPGAGPAGGAPPAASSPLPIAGDAAGVPEAPPSFEMPDHGVGASRRSPAREFAWGWIRRGSWKGSSEGGAWVLVVQDPDGTEVRSRRSILDADGRARAFERVEGLRFLRYAMERRPDGLDALPLAEAPGGAPPAAVQDRPPVEEAAADRLPEGIAMIEVMGPQGSSPEQDPGADPPVIGLRLRLPGRAALEAGFPRALLQRLLLGPDLDLSAGKPLQGLTPPEKVLGGARSLMVAMPPGAAAPPWVGPRTPVPGEENAVRIAAAIGRWWSAGAPSPGAAPAVVVSTDARLSPGRWESAPAASGSPLLLLPEDAFPGPSAPMRDAVARACPGVAPAPSLPADGVPDLVVLVSGEAPGILGARLRALARDRRMKGKLLAVFPMAGPVREDLPSSLLAEGDLAAVGVAEFAPVGVPRGIEAVGRVVEAARAAAPERSRAEEVATGLTWFY